MIKQMLLKLERFLFYFLIFCLPLQVRHIFYAPSGALFNEWTAFSLYATDLLVLVLLGLWLARGRERLVSIKKIFTVGRQPEFFWRCFGCWP